jgi:hypothetical protein
VRLQRLLTPPISQELIVQESSSLSLRNECSIMQIDDIMNWEKTEVETPRANTSQEEERKLKKTSIQTRSRAKKVRVGTYKDFSKLRERREYFLSKKAKVRWTISHKNLNWSMFLLHAANCSLGHNGKEGASGQNNAKATFFNRFAFLIEHEAYFLKIKTYYPNRILTFYQKDHY